MSVAEQLRELLELLAPLQDVLAGRVESPEPPEWCERRGWTAFLLGLSAQQLAHAEAHGLAELLAGGGPAPADLRALAAELTRASQLPELEDGALPARFESRSIKLRKRPQLAGLLTAITPLVQTAERIVDVGAGSGHFTRLSADLFGVPALGVERNAERVQAAARRAAAEPLASYVVADARQSLPLGSRDLAIGLHACGELGDRLVTAVAAAGCDLALVSCCLQKISSEERALLSAAQPALSLRREQLGLSNLTSRPRGVEAPIETSIAGRQTRYALSRLLQARGLMLAPGAEMRGINRRRAQRGLAQVAQHALALRGLPPATEAELAEHTAASHEEFARVRRLSLPRALLARPLEVLVSLDRASYLAERGFAVRLAALFSRDASPRNIALFASRSLSRLPLRC